jgi:hypothetical protein
MEGVHRRGAFSTGLCERVETYPVSEIIREDVRQVGQDVGNDIENRATSTERGREAPGTARTPRVAVEGRH